MQVTVEKLSPVVVEFSVEIPNTRVKTEVEKAYAQLQRTAHIKGYRPGKAPRTVITHLFGPRVHADVAQRLVDQTLNQAIADKSLQPLSKPSVVPSELLPDGAFNYKARFEVRPEVGEVKWEGLSVNKPKLDVKDAQVDEEIESLRREHSTLEPIEEARAAQAGDIVAISFGLVVNGAPLGPQEQAHEAELGKSEIMKDIEDALLGAKVGETKNVTVTFPSSHPSPDLRGKEGVFNVTVKELKKRVLPNVDDEFAKDCGDYTGIDDLKAKIRERLTKTAEQRRGEVVAEQLVVELCKANPIPVPPSLVEQQANVTEREVTQNARRMGQRFDTGPDFKARVRADAEVKVRAGLLMAEIAQTKGIKIEDADLEKGYAELAEQSGKNVAKIKAEYRDARKREMLVAMILEDKILDMLEGAATVTEVDAL